ncbi:response regulator transcription factor [Intestinibacter sp.]
MNQHILIVEDDVDINNLIAKTLTKRNFKVTQAFSGSEASLRISMESYSMILLDLMLPGINGEELIAQIRRNKDVPILVISAKTSLEDKVNLLNLGADDYITKPFELQELVARVNSNLRRYNSILNKESENKLDQDNNSVGNNEKKLIFKELTLNEESREVNVNGNNIYLTSHEFDILNILMKNPQKVYSREALYELVWKSGYYGEDNTVNVHVSNIRKKLKEVSNEEYIKTVWGIGFKLNNE